MEEEKTVTVYVDNIPKFKIKVTKNTQIGQIKKLLGNYVEARLDIYKGKELPKVFSTSKYDKVSLTEVFDRMKESKIFLKTKPITRAFPTGLKDVDLYFLTSLDDDRSLLNALNTNKATRVYRNNEDMWRNRFRRLNPGSKMTPSGKWRDFSLALIKYMDLAKNDYNKAMKLAAKDGNTDLINFFISQGADDWNGGLKGAIEGENLDLVKFFFSQGAVLKPEKGQVS